tara:strand:+ start:3228 stop:3434 length:207 start_codon:yes stop_codon:yes gene_type:complete
MSMGSAPTYAAIWSQSSFARRKKPMLVREFDVKAGSAMLARRKEVLLGVNSLEVSKLDVVPKVDMTQA